MKKPCSGLVKYVLAFGISVVLALAMLIVAAFAPQGRILDNLWQSNDLLHMEGTYPHVSDYEEASRLDNFTDILMLMEAVTTNEEYLGSVLTNPVYVYEEAGADLPTLLENYLNGMPHDSVGFYVRYWMGFRVVLRLALTFLSYFQIRRYLAVIFFTLFAAIMCDIAKRVDSKLAFLFAVSIILLRPHVIVNSMQYCSCFFIMFTAMLLVPAVRRRPAWEGLFFMEVGIATMYFDFYTAPLITFGFPMVYLYALDLADEKNICGKRLGKNAFVWMTGYVMMWVAKLVLTSLLTEVNAVANGWNALMGRLGVSKTEGLEEFYSLELAIERLGDAVFSDGEGKVIYLGVLAVVILAVVVYARRKNVSLKESKGLWPLLALAAIPVGWFLVTIQPFAMHNFFQYRMIGLTYWAAGAFGYFWLFPKKKA